MLIILRSHFMAPYTKSKTSGFYQKCLVISYPLVLVTSALYLYKANMRSRRLPDVARFSNHLPLVSFVLQC